MKNSDLQLNKNEDANLLLMSGVRQRFDKIKQGGGKKSIDVNGVHGWRSAVDRLK